MAPLNEHVAARPVANKSSRARYDSFCKDGALVSEVDDVILPGGASVEVPIVNGDFESLPVKVQQFIARYVAVCQPKGVYLVTGAEDEAENMRQKLMDRGQLVPLDGMDNCYLCRTDPADVARVESKTFIVTKEKHQTVPHVAEGVKGTLGQWMSPEDFDREMMEDRLPGCMKGRVMYVIPFSMGPVGGALSKNGVQLTDSNYVVLSMRVMTRVSADIWKLLRDQDFVQCVHSIGCPRPLKRKVINHWPCNPERTLVTHLPDERRIVSYGSGYGGNSLLGKKCFALRIASRIARDEGWLAEHMLIMGITNPQGEEKYVAAAFPSACGKTNLAMLMPTLPGWKVRTVGDDIAWMRFDKDGRLRAINPEAGFFGVAPGTNNKTNPMAMKTCEKNTIFTNVGMTKEGGVFWEGMEKEVPRDTEITTWKGETWHIGDEGKAAHPNSRFCCPASQCPTIHAKWEDPEGVPIDMIIFGGRRPEGVPLVYESLDWKHGVLVGAALKSQATAAAEHKGKVIMHDPMAMRPFMGYNFGDYLEHWLNMEQPGRQMPKIFHVNWFRVDEEGRFLWPGFGDNVRVLDWMMKRCNGEDVAMPSPIGLLPKEGTIPTQGLKDQLAWDEIFNLPKDFWTEEMAEIKQFFSDQVGSDLPEAIHEQLAQQTLRVHDM